MASRLIKVNRTLSWILVTLALITIVTGYNNTKHFFTYLSPLWLITREIHLWMNWLFIVVLGIHVFVIEGFIWFRWAATLRILRNQKKTLFLWLKLSQKVTGYALLVVSLLVITSGLNWYIIDLGPVLSLYQHVRFDLYLIPILTIHTALGGKLALIRRGITGRVTNISILILTIVIILLAFLVDSNLLRV